ncbi:MAG: YgfZ/GcvT domain-containing protein [Blastopirellula sp. JB062]
MSSPDVPAIDDQLTQLAREGLRFDVSTRTRLQMSGEDRVKFLHNLSTAEIKRLAPAQGCETFIPTLQGKIFGHFFVLPTADSIYLSGVPRQAEPLLPHFQKYAVIEDVEVADRTAETTEYLLAGPQAAAWVEQLCGVAPPKAPLQAVASDDMLAYRTPFVAGPAWGVICRGQASRRAAEEASNWPSGTAETLDALRIEAGFPVYGQDVTVENLAQEANRNETAISFTKGCYLGQETIARIDALGHVNRRLFGFRLAGSTGDARSPVGATWEVEGKTAVQVTSAVYSPRRQAWIGLAMVRRGFDRPGQTLETSHGAVEIVAIPFAE